MVLTRLDLTPANRPVLLLDEILLFVQNAVGLYEGKFKLPNYQNGFVYLTSHRACYVDNEEPRKYAVAVELKEVDRVEPYAGFLKSSPKISLTLRSTSSSTSHDVSSSPANGSSPHSGTPLIRTPTPPVSAGVWICSICSFSNPVPSNYTPGITVPSFIPPCLTCGIRPQPSALDAAVEQHQSCTPTALTSSSTPAIPGSPAVAPTDPDADLACPRCTFHNHPSLPNCELCGSSLLNAPRLPDIPPPRTDSPAPTPLTPPTLTASTTVIKFSFRASGHSTFLSHLKSALIQRKWLLSSAPPVPRPTPVTPTSSPAAGIASLERRGLTRRENAATTITTAFSDLESLMSQAKEMVALAESFSRLNPGGGEAQASLQALGLVSKDQLGGGGAWIDELSRQVAEFLADDARGVLRREGGVMTLVDLWAVYNRARAGIDLVSPGDLEKAAARFEALKLPVKVRRLKSGLTVVQSRGWEDEEAVRRLLAWIADASEAARDRERRTRARRTILVDGDEVELEEYDDYEEWGESEGVKGNTKIDEKWGRGVSAREAAERFGWSIGVAQEELEMAEERGALCREVGIEGVRFWKNPFLVA